MDKEMPAVKERTSRKKYNKKNNSADATLKSNLATDQLCESLDRLKQSTGGRPGYAGPYTEVRFIKEIKRCIQDVVRQMIDGPDTPWPVIEHRYREHRRSHHQCDSYNTACSNIENCFKDRRRSQRQCDSYSTTRDCKQNIEEYRVMESLPCGVPSACDCDEISWNDLKRYVRNTLRKIFVRTPPKTVPCPVIEIRYREHRRMYHRRDSATSPDEEISKEINARVGMDDNTEALSRGEDGKIRKYNQDAHGNPDEHDNVTKKVNPDEYDNVTKKVNPDEYDNVTKKVNPDEHDNVKKNKNPDELNKLTKKVNPDEQDNVEDEAKDIEYEPVDINEQVMLWLQKVPAYYDNTEENKAAIKEMVPEFVSTLQDANNEPDREDRVIDETQKFLNKLPVDENSEEEEEDEYDEIKEFIQLWIEVIDFDLTTKAGNMITKTQLVNSLMCRLEPTVRHCGTNDELRNEVLALIPEYKNSLKDDANFTNQIRENAENLVSALNMLVIRKGDKKRKRIRSKFLQPILKWLNGTEYDQIPDDVKDNLKRSAVRSEMKLEEMLSENVGNKEIMNEMENFLDNIPQVEFNTEQKSLLAENVLKEIRVPSKMSKNEKTRHSKTLMENIRPREKKKSGKKDKHRLSFSLS